MKKFIFVILIVIFPVSVQASKVTDAEITRVHMYINPTPNGGVFLTVVGDRTGNDCSNTEFFIDLNNERGKLLYSHALSAHHARSQVNVTGTGVCSLHGAETIKDLQVFRASQ